SFLHLLSILFFFSSRRRHTRSKRDWSSDVCSSDLLRHLQELTHQFISLIFQKLMTPSGGSKLSFGFCQFHTGRRDLRRCHISARSEERRVGKEGRSRWGRGR